MANEILNPNFWLCVCVEPDRQLHTVFETSCKFCHRISIGAPRAGQSMVNDQALRLQSQMKVIKDSRHQLPDQRVRPLPDRDAFEQADDTIQEILTNNGGNPPVSWNPAYRRYQAALLVIKRYKHAA